MKIWVDLDEVLAETIEKLLKDNNYKLWNKFLKKEDIRSYYIYEMEELWLNKEQTIELFRKVLFEDKKYKIKPVEWALEKLIEWRNKWYDLEIITARNNILKDYTFTWVEKNFPNIFSDIHFVGHFTPDHTPKSVVCKNIWVDIMIEDNFEYAKDVANCWIKTFLIEKPWNKDLWESKNIVRVKSWDEIEI